MRNRTRKGYIMAEILVGLIILAGAFVAMSQFLGGALRTTQAAQIMSGALLDSYAVVQGNALREDLSGSPDIFQRAPGKTQKYLEYELKFDVFSGDSRIKQDADDLDLLVYDVMVERIATDKEVLVKTSPLRVYRYDFDD